MSRISKDLLHLAGEYRTCSELLKRGVFATITYGNRKAVDVYAIGDVGNKAVRIEVKTSQQKRFVTSITQKGLATSDDAPDFWVLCQMKSSSDGVTPERFFVLSHEEICRVQDKINRDYSTRYTAKHGRGPRLSGGVDNVRLESVEKFENAWDKIIQAVGRRATSADG